MTEMLRADDLQVFLEVARHGRLTEAARVLKVDHTTVGRHVSRLERSVQQRLFNHEPGGWTLTDAGVRLLAHAEAVEAAVLAAGDDCLLNGQRLTGTVRVVTPEGFGAYLLAPGLGRFSGELGGLTVEVVTANRHASLTSREFDVAVTLDRPQARGVTIAKLADYSLRFFASPRYLAGKPAVARPDELAQVHDFIWYVDEALGAGSDSLLHRLVPGAVPRTRSNSISAQVSAAQHGAGVALLPGFIGDSVPGLQRLPGFERTITHDYWMVTPHNLGRLARVVTVTRILERLVRETGGLTCPQRPR